MKFVKSNFRLIILIALLILGIVVGIYLVGKPQIFKSKATSSTSDAFDISDEQNNPIYCQNGVCQSNSNKINLKLKDLLPFKKPLNQ